MNKHDILETIRTRPETKAIAKQMARDQDALRVQFCSSNGIHHSRLYCERTRESINQPRSMALEYAISRTLIDLNCAVGRHFLCDWAAVHDVRFEILPFDEDAPEDLRKSSVVFRAPSDHHGSMTVRTREGNHERGETAEGVLVMWRSHLWTAAWLRYPKDQEKADRTLVEELGRILEAMEKKDGTE